VSGTTTTKVVTGLTSGASYVFRVVAAATASNATGTSRSVTVRVG
jgi:hypothetical protein